jgi:hypothetical protein
MLALTSHGADAAEDAAKGADPEAVKKACVAKWEPERKPWGQMLLDLSPKIDAKNVEPGDRCRLITTFEFYQEKLLASMLAEKICVPESFPKLEHYIQIRRAGMSWAQTELQKCLSVAK